jgi:hypothetical protein
MRRNVYQLDQPAVDVNERNFISRFAGHLDFRSYFALVDFGQQWQGCLVP